MTTTRRRPAHAIWSCLALSASVSLAQPPEAAVGGFEGVWKMCYVPGLEDVVEIDQGYLVLMPGGESYEVGASCCGHFEDLGPKPPFWERSTYEVDGTAVILHSTSYAGEEVERRLDLHEQTPTVLFDEPHAQPKVRDVLSAGEDLNYAYCRVYPAWPVGEAPHDNPLEQSSPGDGR